MRWLPLVHGQGPLTAAHGFASQGDVVIEARRAADLLGATPMDRPEDVETNPVNGRVYVMLTNNSSREARRRWTRPIPGPEHPRPCGRDHPARRRHRPRWTTPPRRRAGASSSPPGKPGIDAGAQYHRATSDQGWLSCPDNCAFDSKGRIWIATDGAPFNAGVADGLYAADTAGPGRALTRLFYQAPTGAEVCGPRFTPDDRTIFLAIQHPGRRCRQQLRPPLHPLARLPGRRAAAAFGDRHRAEGWRDDRQLATGSLIDTRARRFTVPPNHEQEAMPMGMSLEQFAAQVPQALKHPSRAPRAARRSASWCRRR